MSETIEASPAPPTLRRRITLPQYDWRPRLRWFAAEIVVVVAGVLIALAINAWWAARQQAREELDLLAALLAEFSSNQPRLAELVAFHEEVKTTAQRLLALSADPRSSVASDSVDRLLADVSWWSSYTTLESTVLDAAVEDGRLNLIRTDSLRQLLATWRAGAASASTWIHLSRALYWCYIPAWPRPALRTHSRRTRHSGTWAAIPRWIM